MGSRWRRFDSLSLLALTVVGCARRDAPPTNPRELDATVDVEPVIDRVEVASSDIETDARADARSPEDSPDASALDASTADASGPRVAPATLGAGFVDITPTALRAGFFPPPADSSGRRLLTGGAFADVDGDGRREVVFIHRDPRPGGPGVPLVWRVVDGALSPATGFDAPVGVVPTLFTDFDGDGRADLFGLRAAPLRPDSSLIELSGHLTFRYGLPGGGFEEGPRITAAPDVTLPFTLESASLADLDSDGWLDLVLADNSCCSTCRAVHPLLRVGPRSYEDRADLLRGDLRGGAYTALAAPFFDDAITIGAIGRLCVDSQHAFFRATAPGDDGYPRFEGYDPTPSNAVFREVSKGVSCPTIACNAPMSAAWTDLDGDARLDVFIPLDPLHSMFRGTASPPWRDVTSTFAFQRFAGPHRPMLAWGSAFVDVDGDGRDDLVAAHGDDDSSAYDPSHLIGPQRATLLWNGGADRWVDLSSLAHLDREGQWRALALGDLDEDGDADVVVGGFGEPPRVYQNRVDAGGHTLSLRLRGTLSNALGVGAKVETWLSDRDAPVTRVMGSAASPVVGYEPAVFIGTAALTRAPRVRITWPSGVVQSLTDLDTGRAQVVTEPVGFAIEPASRHVAADGVAAAVLRVTPADTTSSVSARLRGAGAITVTRDGAAWTIRVVAPRVAGSSTVVISLDGAELRVRPRLWWDATG